MRSSKRSLFLGAGSVYHAVHTYDMPVLGGLRKKMPWTAYTMLVGTLAISGVPFFSGFYSKDAILGSAFLFATRRPEHMLLAILPSVGALLTAFYMFRMWFLLSPANPDGPRPTATRPTPPRPHHTTPTPRTATTTTPPRPTPRTATTTATPTTTRTRAPA